MAQMLQVNIVTPERSVFHGPAGSVVLPAWEGEMGVFPDHDAMLCLIRAGICTVHGADESVRFVVGRGFAEIGADLVTILTDAAETAGGVDKARASAELAAAEAEMAQHDAHSEKHKQARIAYELAQARLGA